MSKNSVENWQRRLAGEVVTIHDGFPDYGFYRIRSRDKTSWRPVAYWYDGDGTLRCRLGDQDLAPQQSAELWSWASQHAITHELYTAVLAGEPWPDLNPVVTQTNNAPADNSFEALQERIDDLAREAERLIKAGAATTKEAADQAADVANALAKLQATADKERETEKRPHLQAGRDIDDRWRPLITAADVYSRLKNAVCAPFLAAQKRKKDAEEADARRVAEAKAQAARAAEAEAQRAAEEAARSGDAAAVQAAEKAKADADIQTQVANAATQKVHDIATTTVTVGTRGRSVGLRGKTVVVIEDRDAVLAFFKDRQEITDLLQKMAETAVKAKITVPGVKTDKAAQAA